MRNVLHTKPIDELRIALQRMLRFAIQDRGLSNGYHQCVYCRESWPRGEFHADCHAQDCPCAKALSALHAAPAESADDVAGALMEARARTMGDQNRGLYDKYTVRRTDRTDMLLGEKHYGCEYFVLDLTHDRFALNALIAYEQVCRDEYPLLADDLAEKIRRMKALQGTFFSGPSGHGR